MKIKEKSYGKKRIEIKKSFLPSMGGESWVVEYYSGVTDEDGKTVTYGIGIPIDTEPHELAADISVIVFELFAREFLDVDIKKFKEEMGITGKMKYFNSNLEDAMNYIEKDMANDRRESKEKTQTKN